MLSGRRMDPERFETLLIHGSVPDGEGSMEERADAEGARHVMLPELSAAIDPLKDAIAGRRLAGIVRSFRPHIVHTHTAKAGFLGRAAALTVRPRPAIVHTFHGHVLEGYFGPAKSRLYRDLERLLARRSDVLIGVSQATVDDLVRLGVAPADRFRVVPLGLDLSRFEVLSPQPGGSVRNELDLGPDDVLALFVGRLVPIKRVDVLLRAFAIARDSGAARLRLAIVGDGELRQELEKLAADLGVASEVTFLGYRRDLPELAAAADLAVLSSDNEGTPVSLIETGAAARPAVATDVGGVRAVVTETSGRLAPAGDSQALGQALAELAADAELRGQMGAAARAHVTSRFSIERLLGDLSALYEELAASR